LLLTNFEVINFIQNVRWCGANTCCRDDDAADNGCCTMHDVNARDCHA